MTDTASPSADVPVPRPRAVALHASGWWRPQPADALDLVPAGDGWWEIVLEAPADWRASYGFVEHDGPGDPPWWKAGLKAPGAPVHPDALCAHRHGAAPGGYDWAWWQPALLHDLAAELGG